MALHADQNNIPAPWAPYPCALNIGFVLDPFTDANATRYVPGSHNNDHQPAWASSHPSAIPVRAPAGSMILMEGRVFHQTGPNSGTTAQVLQPSIARAARGVGLVLQHLGVTVADVWNARSALECDAVGVLASNHRARDVRALRSTADRIESMLDQPEVFAVGALDFHEDLVRLSGNTTLHVLTQALHEIVAAEMQLSRQQSTPSEVARGNVASTRVHAKLIDHIAGGNTTLAVDLWRRNMARVGELLLRSVGPAYVIDIVE